jgi:hypothetical protein
MYIGDLLGLAEGLGKRGFFFESSRLKSDA